MSASEGVARATLEAAQPELVEMRARGSFLHEGVDDVVERLFGTEPLVPRNKQAQPCDQWSSAKLGPLYTSPSEPSDHSE